MTAPGWRVRSPRPDDLDDVFRIHGDPRTNVHNPAGPDADLGASRARLDLAAGLVRRPDLEFELDGAVGGRVQRAR